MATILTTKKDYPSLLGIINKAIDKAIRGHEEQKKKAH